MRYTSINCIHAEGVRGSTGQMHHQSKLQKGLEIILCKQTALNLHILSSLANFFEINFVQHSFNRSNTALLVYNVLRYTVTMTPNLNPYQH